MDSTTTSTAAQAATTSTDGTEAAAPRFTPGYPPVKGLRIHRVPIRVEDDGTATVTFRGQIDDATTDLWVEQGSSGRPSLYAEVRVDDTTATEVTVAVVPTGKRVPGLQGGGVGQVSRALRLGSAGRVHIYLLGVDGTADRGAFEARVEAERQARAAARQAALVNAIFDFDGDSISPLPGAPSGQAAPGGVAGL